MATIEAEKLHVGPNSATYRWANLVADSEDGAWIEIPDFPNLCVQALGTFSAGSVAIQGSNDEGTTAAALNDVEGAAIGLAAAGIVQVQEKPRHIRPLLSGEDGSDDITIILHATR